MLQGHERQSNISLESLNRFSDYWESVREWYYPFESELKAGTAEVFDHEIPGGQYSNLRPQARSLGLEDQFETIKKNYVVVNRMFGDIIKVTPSSKVVGDMALFMTANGYTEEDIYEKGDSISFPDSVIELFRGDLGQNPGGFPEKLSKIILKDIKPNEGRPNDHMEPIDLDKAFKNFQTKFGSNYTFLDFLSYSFYPKVFEEYAEHRKEYGEVMTIPSTAFFYGLKPNEEIMIELGRGKKILISLLQVSMEEPGTKTVYFRLNGQVRAIKVEDKTQVFVKKSNRKASLPNEIGVPLQGKLSKILVTSGQKITKNQALFSIEAMKMESTVIAPMEGVVLEICLKEGSLVEQDDLVVILQTTES
jgi:pyruvate carboxylase